jgi:general secretion pathway protein A
MNGRLEGISPATIFSRPTADETWLGPTQASALSQMTARCPLLFLHGEPATGRTTLLARLAADLTGSGSAVVWQLSAASNNHRAILGSLLEQAGLNPWEISSVDQRNLLTLLINERHAQKRRIVLLIDDGDKLSDDALAEIDRLGTFACPEHRAIEVRIAASADLLPKLVERVRQDAPTCSVELNPLSENEVAAYVDWRMARCGVDHAFSAPALQLLCRLSQGYFRGIDTLCRLAIPMAQKRGVPRADVRSIHEAALLLSRLKNQQRPAAQSRPATLTNRLTVTERGESLMQLELKPRVLIGRSPENDLCLPGQHVSKHHALIQVRGEHIELVDLNSSNGM